MDLMEAILKRRSIRKYKSDPIPDSLLQQVLEAARWAPSWANTQCSRFIIVKDQEVKEKLRDTLTPTNPARGAMIQAPVVIVACGELKRAGYKKGEAVTDKGDWFMFDVALALANLTLTAHSLGLGTVHVGAFDAQKAAELLNVSDDIAVVELIPLGYPDQEPTAPPRKELSEFVFYEKYH